jgi:GT2 family glycosyltransferase
MSSSPEITVIVPSRNRPNQIKRCLVALAAQDHPNFDVIVVDDGSEPPLSESINPQDYALSCQLIRQANTGPAGARNTGIHAASGQFAAFTDDDCWPAPDWLSGLVEVLRQHPNMLVGGLTENAVPQNIYTTTSQLLITIVYNYSNRDPYNAVFFASNNMAVSRHDLLDLQGFDASFRMAAEDRELCDRWRAHGGKLVYVPTAVVFHAHIMNLRTFCKQHFNYGRSAWTYHCVTRARQTGGTACAGNLYLILLKQFVRPEILIPLSKSLRVGMLLVLSQIVYVTGIIVAALGR